MQAYLISGSPSNGITNHSPAIHLTSHHKTSLLFLGILPSQGLCAVLPSEGTNRTCAHTPFRSFLTTPSKTVTKFHPCPLPVFFFVELVTILH